MDKETLFRDVRRGEVLLWVGAGLSRYAGYPMGAKTVTLLHGSLSVGQQQQLDPSLALPRYSENLVDLHNGQRFHLTRELQRIFTAEPTSTEYHEMLAKIPFLDKIVTTNYDTLFERVYGSRLHKIMKGRDIPLGEPNQVEFYKVHGDIHQPETLVVTEGDYRSFFKKQDDLLWKQLEALMAQRTVLFLGYSLEDQNVLALFEELLEKLGPIHRGAYLVAPGFKEPAINRLRRRNVTYLDLTGEDFIKELWASINDNILLEAKKGTASSDKTSQFLRGLGLTFRYDDNPEDAGHAVTSLTRLDGPTTWSVDVRVREGAPVIRQLRDLEAGKTSSPAYIPEADLEVFRLVVEGLRMPSDNIASLIVCRAPGFDKVVDVFFDGGPRFYGVKMRCYGRGEEVQFVAHTAHATLKAMVNMDAEAGYSGTINVTPRGDIFSSVQAGFEVCSLMRATEKGLGCRIFENGNQVWEMPAHPITGFTGAADQLQRIMEDLQLVEDSFGVVFQNFHYTDADAPGLYALAQILRRAVTQHPGKTAVTFTWSKPPEDEEFKKIVADDKGSWSIMFEDLITLDFDFMGWRFQAQTLRCHFFEQALLKKTKQPTTYRLTSKSGQVMTIVKEVRRKEVVQRGQPQTPKTDAELLIEELLTDETPTTIS